MLFVIPSRLSHKTLWRRTTSTTGEVKLVSCGDSGEGKKSRYEVYLRLGGLEESKPNVEVSIWGVDGYAGGGEGQGEKSMGFKYETGAIGSEGENGNNLSLYGSDSGIGEGRLNHIGATEEGITCKSNVKGGMGEDKKLEIENDGVTGGGVGEKKIWKKSKGMRCKGGFLTKNL